MNQYRRTSTTVSLINCHFVFCPRYRRKIFLKSEVEEGFKALVQEVCEKLKIVIVALECDKDHTHMFLHALSTLSPAEIMAKGKGITSEKLCEEFPHLRHLPSLWTRSYFVSTAGNVTSETDRWNNKKQGGESYASNYNSQSQIVSHKRTGFGFRDYEQRVYLCNEQSHF